MSGTPIEIPRRRFLGLAAGAAVGVAVAGTWRTMAFPQAAAAAADEAPVLLRTSQGVGPGRAIGIFGEGLVPDQTRIFVSPLSSGDREPVPEGGVDVEPVDVQERFALAVLPASLPPGAYALWAETPHGRSRPALVNAPIVWWVEDQGCYAGQKLRVFGRNLAPVSDGAKPTVRLVDEGGASLAAEALSSDEYALAFEVPAGVVSGKTYTVRVGNGLVGATAEAISPRRLTAVAVPTDPLNLGVSWAGDWNWKRQVNARDHGAKGDGRTEDTAAIHTALQAVANRGGGVVRLEAGRYMVGDLSIPAGTVLLGDSRDNTELVGLNGDRFAVRGDSGGRTGVARLSVAGRVQMGDGYRPDEKFASSRCFVVNCRLHDQGNDPTIAFCVKDRVLIRDNDIESVDVSPCYMTVTDGYVLFQKNRIRYAAGSVNYHGNFSVLEDNHLEGDQTKVDGNLHGFMIEGKKSGCEGLYVARNTIENMGNPGQNDGETICYEPPGGIIAAGQAMGGDANGLTDANPPLVTCGKHSCAPEGTVIQPSQEQELINPNHEWRADYFKGFSVLITEGRGIGQLRRIVGNDAHRIEVDRAWEVVPDGSSRYAINSYGARMIWVDNTVRSSRGGMQLYYNCYENVVARNTSIDTSGLWTHTHNTTATMKPVFFNDLRDNTIEGVSTVSGTGVCGLISDARSLTSGGQVPTGVYGNELRRNTITDPGDPNSLWKGLSIRAFGGSRGPGIVATIAEKNNVTGEGAVIQLGSGTTDTLLLGNTGPVQDSGSVRAFVLASPPDDPETDDAD